MMFVNELCVESVLFHEEIKCSLLFALFTIIEYMKYLDLHLIYHRQNEYIHPYKMETFQPERKICVHLPIIRI